MVTDCGAARCSGVTHTSPPRYRLITRLDKIKAAGSGQQGYRPYRCLRLPAEVGLRRSEARQVQSGGNQRCSITEDKRGDRSPIRGLMDGRGPPPLPCRGAAGRAGGAGVVDRAALPPPETNSSRAEPSRAEPSPRMPAASCRGWARIGPLRLHGLIE